MDHAPNLERPLFNRADFRIPEGVAHLCAGGEPPFLFTHDEALAARCAVRLRLHAGRLDASEAGTPA